MTEMTVAEARRRLAARKQRGSMHAALAKAREVNRKRGQRTEQRLLQALRDNPEATKEEIAQLAGLSHPKAVNSVLRRMFGDGSLANARKRLTD